MVVFWMVMLVVFVVFWTKRFPETLKTPHAPLVELAVDGGLRVREIFTGGAAVMVEFMSVRFRQSP